MLCNLTDAKLQGHQLAIDGITAPAPVVKIVMEPESEEVSGLILVLLMGLMSICIQKLLGNTRAVVPTTTQYFMATGKQALALLQTAAGVIPVPLLQDAIGIAMKIIEVCEVRRILRGKALRRLICLSGGISCSKTGQRVAREGHPSHDRYCGQCNGAVRRR